MQITIDKESGFCLGVIRAIQIAEQALAAGMPLYSLGEIVHNNAEVQRLRGQGLCIVQRKEYERMSNANVLIRAHGESPQTYSIAMQNGIRLIDATCPVVLRLQQKIRNTYKNMPANTQILIFGQKGHAEVNGLVGQTDGRAQVIESLDGITDWRRHIILFAQTTMSREGFAMLCDGIRQRLPAHLNLEAHDTTCRRVFARVEHLRRFAAQHDVIVFVCGASSSNGGVLFNVCREVNKKTYRVETAVDLQPAWFAGCRSTGICGAASTPQWHLRNIAEAIENMDYAADIVR